MHKGKNLHRQILFTQLFVFHQLAVVVDVMLKYAHNLTSKVLFFYLLVRVMIVIRLFLLTDLIMNQREQTKPCAVDAITLSEALIDNPSIQTKPGESTEVIDEHDLADVKVETDQEVRSPNVNSVNANDVIASKEELLEELKSNVDNPRPMCFGPIKKQKKSRRNRSKSSNPITSDKVKAPIPPKGDSGTNLPTSKNSMVMTSGGKSQGTPKRQRSNNNSPLNQQKRPKINTSSQVKDHQGTYADVSSDDLRLLVLDEENGITKKQVEILEEKMMEIFDRFLETSPSRVPEYWTANFAFANVKYVCANEFSVQWLISAVKSMSEPWTGARLTTKRMSEVRKMRSKPTPKPQIKFFVPDGMKKKSFEEVTKHIQLRNPPIVTNGWNAWKEEPVPNGTFYHVSVDDSSIGAINMRNCRLFYYFSTIKVIIPKAKNLDEDSGKSHDDDKQV